MKLSIYLVALFLLGLSTTSNAQSTISDITKSDPNLKTLSAALEASDLASVLDGEGPFTVFAPTEAAFAALPEGKLQSLLLPENKDKLIKLLKYHVVSGDLASADIGDGQKMNTLSGSAFVIAKSGNTIKLNGASVIKADVKATNGVVHVINKVMLPPGL